MNFEDFDFSSLSKISTFDLKTKPKGKGTDVKTTMATIEELKENVLPYGTSFGMKFRTIDVFWNTMSMFQNSTTGSCQSAAHPTIEEEDTTKKEGVLTTARPPDGMVLPIWRRCHMGILLQAFRGDDKAAGLTVAIHLHQDGIRMVHDFGTAPLKKVVNRLRPDENGAIYSAGVTRDIDVEVELLLDFVKTFKTSGYSPFTFNCQHFTSGLYYHFTNQLLSECLRRRWTSNKGVFGNSLSDTELKKKRMEWASGSQLLMTELEPVEGEPYLFYRSPPTVGGMMKMAAAVGATAARRFPLTALAVVAGTAILDNVTAVSVRRFERSVIWFKYCESKEEWYWSPYRDQEYQGDDRWISIHQREVPGGPYAGKELQRTSARIASVLANNTFNPRVVEEKDCPICLDSKPATMFVSSGRCSHSICHECFKQVELCPFCRVAY